jgi:hypothetical protein
MKKILVKLKSFLSSTKRFTISLFKKKLRIQIYKHRQVPSKAWACHSLKFTTWRVIHINIARRWYSIIIDY